MDKIPNVSFIEINNSTIMTGMNSKSLKSTNRHLKNAAKAKAQLVRSVASSTAIETGEPIEKIEAKLIRQRPLPTRVKLA